MCHVFFLFNIFLSFCNCNFFTFQPRDLQIDICTCVRIDAYYINIGHIEYVQRTAWTVMGIIAAVIIPVVACIVGGFLYIRKNQTRGGSTKSWGYTGRVSTADNESTLSKPLKAYDDRAITPISDASTIETNSSPRKRRSYDRVYRTHEPLPNRPDIDFEDKEWDLKEPVSLTGSDSGADSIRKTNSPTRESDV